MMELPLRRQTLQNVNILRNSLLVQMLRMGHGFCYLALHSDTSVT